VTIYSPGDELRLALINIIVFIFVFGVVSLWRHRIPGLALARSIRGAFYLTRYSWALGYYGLRRTETKSHVEALRADLGAVDPKDIDATLRGLGPPRTLAAEVTSGTLRPTWLRGLVWVWAAWVFALAISGLVIDAFLGGFEAVAAQGDQASWSGWGLKAAATMGDNGRAEWVEGGGAALLLLPLGAFVLGTRPWRLLSHSKPESETPPGL